MNWAYFRTSPSLQGNTLGESNPMSSINVISSSNYAHSIVNPILSVTKQQAMESSIQGNCPKGLSNTFRYFPKGLHKNGLFVSCRFVLKHPLRPPRLRRRPLRHPITTNYITSFRIQYSLRAFVRSIMVSHLNSNSKQVPILKNTRTDSKRLNLFPNEGFTGTFVPLKNHPSLSQLLPPF